MKIRVIVPGANTDQRWVRLASRRLFGPLLDAGIRIYEYAPGMTHVKCLLVDDLWTVVGTTHFDNRSFEHNDEVNVAVRDEAVAARLFEDFTADIAHSREIVLDRWRRRHPRPAHGYPDRRRHPRARADHLAVAEHPGRARPGPGRAVIGIHLHAQETGA